MYSQRDLARLLALFPATFLQREAGERAKNKRHAVQRLASDWSADRVFDFACSDFMALKQHVAVFEVRGYEVSPDLGRQTERLHHQESEDEVGRHFHSVLRLTYEVVLLDPLEVREVVFPWPIRVTYRRQSDTLTVHSAIMAKNIRHHTPVEDGQRVAVTSRTPTETEMLQELEGLLLEEGVTVHGLDLHRGIKCLWNEGVIDAPSAKWRKSKSTTLEEMNPGFFLRRDYPQVYESLDDKPLFRTSFAVFDAAGCETGEKFTADPELGTLSFPVYPPGTKSIDSILDKILRRN